MQLKGSPGGLWQRDPNIEDKVDNQQWSAVKRTKPGNTLLLATTSGFSLF
jgi:hypothetical protein